MWNRLCIPGCDLYQSFVWKMREARVLKLRHSIRIYYWNLTSKHKLQNFVWQSSFFPLSRSIALFVFLFSRFPILFSVKNTLRKTRYRLCKSNIVLWITIAFSYKQNTKKKKKTAKIFNVKNLALCRILSTKNNIFQNKLLLIIYMSYLLLPQPNI